MRRVPGMNSAGVRTRYDRGPKVVRPGGARTLRTEHFGHRYERNKVRYERDSWHRYERSNVCY